ncbi:VOC family protein [Fulvivirga lutimaris]|uniref:VOC family protein n=1 Tax=Fulvivirga lutimaris TaxID=1819566 RepID=UPI0012BD0E04|nr:VOC family protein [Fulvivirga lutimaris]MTI38112.1 VOC family protein [Fulvivirga lutimaris]
MRTLLQSLIVVFICFACSKQQENHLDAFEVFCEMVANGNKPLALHHPLAYDVIEKNWDQYKAIADNYNVQLFREDNFPKTLLFPFEATENKSVILIYTGQRLKQYEQLKAAVEEYPKEEELKMGIARRLGRLLGYGNSGINDLLSKNTAYRSLASFEVKKQVTHLYYENIEEAISFYEGILGLNKVDSSLFQIGDEVFIHLHAFNETHVKDQPKSTAVALLTDQLPEWYSYLQDQQVPIKYTYKPRTGGPHDGFVAVDPGGYLLEFEQFKQHPENELFMAVLAEAPRTETSTALSFYGSITWTYHKDMLKMESFYEEVLGYQKVADQGWTKIYQTSASGFIGLVDECRGMENYAVNKAVELEWQVEDVNAFNRYANEHWEKFDYNNSSFTGPENYIYHIQ